MTDHVGIGKVEHDHVVFIGFDLFDDLFRNDRCIHFRLQVIGCDLRRRY